MPVTVQDPWRGIPRAQLKSAYNHIKNMLKWDRRRRARRPQDSGLLSVRDLVFLSYCAQGLSELQTYRRKRGFRDTFPQLVGSAAAEAEAPDVIVQQALDDDLPPLA